MGEGGRERDHPSLKNKAVGIDETSSEVPQVSPKLMAKVLTELWRACGRITQMVKE